MAPSHLDEPVTTPPQAGVVALCRAGSTDGRRARKGSRAVARRHALVLLVATALGGCKIVANSELKAARTNSNGEFDAAAYVDKIWSSKVLPDFKSRAIDLDTLLQATAKDPDGAGKTYGQRAGEGNPWTYEIKGEGKVVAVDLASRHGLVSVEARTASGSRKVDLQVGPVVFGTVLRDSLSFIQFGDFVNQIQYAQVSRGLNDRAVRDVREQFDMEHALGKTVAFHAAAVLSGSDESITATPVEIEPAQGERK
jgi:predicted lipoprotein